MVIVNQTGLKIIVNDDKLMIKVTYNVEKHLLLNQAKTYGPCSEDTVLPDSLDQTLFYTININEYAIRESRLKFNHISYSCINSMSFWAFIKNKFKKHPAEPQTVGETPLPLVAPGDTITWSLPKCPDIHLTFPDFPWTVTQLRECLPYVIDPVFHTIAYAPLEKTLTLQIIYPTDGISPLTLSPGVTHHAA